MRWGAMKKASRKSALDFRSSPCRAYGVRKMGEDLCILFPLAGGRLQGTKGADVIARALQANARPQGEIRLVRILFLGRKGGILAEGEGEGESLESVKRSLEIAGELRREGREGLPLSDDVFASLEKVRKGLETRQTLRPEIGALQRPENFRGLEVQGEGPFDAVRRSAQVDAFEAVHMRSTTGR